METFGIWLAAFVTLAALSLLIKENPVFRLVEHIFLGVTAGHAVVVAYGVIRKDAVMPIFEKGALMPILPILLGLMLYLRFNKKWASWARIPLAVLIGTGAAVAARSAVQSDFLNQISATVLPLVGSNMTFMQTLNNLIIVIGVTSVMAYFVFTYFRSWSGPMRVPPEIGKWVMMVTFGAAFGNAAMGRLSLLVGRVTFLLKDWLGIMQS